MPVYLTDYRQLIIALAEAYYNAQCLAYSSIFYSCVGDEYLKTNSWTVTIFV